MQILSPSETRLTALLGTALILLFAFWQSAAFAHGVEGHDQEFIASAAEFHQFPFMYLGAKHMVTGYDHLLYLAGVIFFLHRLRDVVKFVSLFAIGHSITLLFGVLAGIHINPHIVDAIIGLSVCYKALENLGVLGKYTGIALDPKMAVFGFGLVHGFGLSTKLQDLDLSPDGLVLNMLSFNIGVEIGQVVALTFLFLLFVYLRGRQDFAGISRVANILLFGAGILLTAMQVAGLLV